MSGEPLEILLVFLIFLLAGTVKGVTGMGLPTVGVGLLVLLMPPAAAAALIVVPSLATNLWQAFDGPTWKPLVRRLWPMLAAICVGTAVGGALPLGAPGASAALGAVLAVYGGLGLAPKLRPAVPPRAEPALRPVVGLLTGAVTAVTGVFVVPATPFLGALGLGRDALVQALGLSFSVSTLALGALLAARGGFGGGAGFASLLALLPAALGMALGARLRRAMPPELFRRVFFGGLVALGAHLLQR